MIDFYSNSLPELEVVKEKQVKNETKLYILNHCKNNLKVDDGSGNFKVENLFSELKTECQKEIARQNLGVEFQEDLKINWENIIGDPLSSNLWEIMHEALKLKADLQSPILEGYPMTPDPDDYCNKSQIANVRWTEKTAESIATKITKELAPEIAREVAIELINNAFDNYTPPSSGGGETAPSTPVVNNYVYFGIEDDISKMSKTTNSSFTITLNKDEYLFILIYNNDIASFSVNGFVGGFELIGNVIVDNKEYFKYKSFYSGLGKITVSIL
jgi:hypothetical protein